MEDYNPNNYNQNPNGFNNNPYGQFYNINDGQKPIWAAIVSFVASVVNIVFCCCCTYFTVPVSLTLGIISLAKKWRGTGFAVSGVVISAFTIVIMAVSQIMFGTMSRDLRNIIINSEQYAEEYRETGEIPEEFEKYNDEKYDAYWSILGYDDFEDFFSDMMESDDTSDSDEDSIDDDDFSNDDDFYDGRDIDDFGETPIDL